MHTVAQVEGLYACLKVETIVHASQEIRVLSCQNLLAYERVVEAATLYSVVCALVVDEDCTERFLLKSASKLLGEYS